MDSIFMISYSYTEDDRYTQSSIDDEFAFRTREDAEAFMKSRGLLTYEQKIEQAKADREDKFEEARNRFDTEWEAYKKALELGVSADVLKTPVPIRESQFFTPVRDYYEIREISFYTGEAK